MLEANFISGYEKMTIAGLTQWDKGQQLQITGLTTLPATFQMHFANTVMDEAIVLLGTTTNGVGLVDIPNSLLEAGLDIKGWIYLIEANDYETVKTILFSVAERTKPADFISEPNPTEQTMLETTLNTVNTTLGDIANLQSKIAPLIYSGVAHNSIYRGKNLGASVSAEQYAAISAGTFEDLYIGDYWTIGGVNYRVAAFDYYLNCGDTATLSHHAVIVPDTCLYSAVMNTTDTTTGGYVATQMYITNLAQANITTNAAFSDHVLNHRIFLVNSVTNGYSSGGGWRSVSAELMNEQMVYGSGIFSPVSTGSAVPTNYRVEKNQLPLFAMNPAMLNTRETYWLRDVVTSFHFAYVNYGGNASYAGATATLGVRPAFCIS